jgi:hypothetical protein
VDLGQMRIVIERSFDNPGRAVSVSPPDDQVDRDAVRADSDKII